MYILQLMLKITNPDHGIRLWKLPTRFVMFCRWLVSWLYTYFRRWSNSHWWSKIESHLCSGITNLFFSFSCLLISSTEKVFKSYRCGINCLFSFARECMPSYFLNFESFDLMKQVPHKGSQTWHRWKVLFIAAMRLRV